MKLLSVVVPIYNAEKYLRQCIDTLVNQTYENIEIILVDDGSTDSSGDICEAYVANYHYVKCIHKENAGVMEARNDGLRAANGEYIALVDADDCLDLDCYEILIENLEKYDCDISTCYYCDEYKENIKIVKKHEHIPEVKLFTKNEALLEVVGTENSRLFSGFVWNKVYKRKCVEGIWFRDDVAITDDLMFTWDVISQKVEKACFVYLPMYHYRFIFSSLTKNSNISKQIKALNAWDNIIKDVKVRGLEKECMASLGMSYIVWNIKICERMLGYDQVDAESYEFVKRNIYKYKEYIPLLGIRHKILANAILKSWNVYKFYGEFFYKMKQFYVSIKK